MMCAAAHAVRVALRGHYTFVATGVWRSLVAHPLWERGAVGSNPATPTNDTGTHVLEESQL